MFGFNGHEKIDEVNNITGSTIDMGDRWLNTQLGRTFKTDAKAKKYPSVSPYSYALNNPNIYNDPDGKDVILMVWATGNGYGHAAIAVSNYKTEYYKVIENGKEITKSRQVKDGTYTYYDLWPGKDNNGDGVSDEIGSAGPKDMFSGPIAHYQTFKNISENDIINGDPSGGEGRPPDGVIKLYSDYDEDMETIEDIKSHMKNNKQYTSVVNNCSDFGTTGVSEVLDRTKGWIELFSDEYTDGINYTTPNGLYKYVQERIKDNPKEGVQLKDPGKVIDTKFEDAVIEPAKQQQKGN